MSRTTVTFNSYVLTTYYDVSDMRVSLLPRDIGTTKVDGMDGAVFTGARLSSKDITLTLTARGTSLTARQTAARTLAAALAVDEPKPLAFSIDGGLYYMAIPLSTSDASYYYNATRFEVTFRCIDPVMYGDEQSVSLTNSTAKTFTVGGTYPTYPVITSTSCKGSSSSVAYCRILDTTSGEYMDIPVPYSDGHTVTLDCAERTLKVDGSTALITLDSDWLCLTPGSVTLQRSKGTGTFTVTWKERWL